MKNTYFFPDWKNIENFVNFVCFKQDNTAFKFSERPSQKYIEYLGLQNITIHERPKPENATMCDTPTERATPSKPENATMCDTPTERATPSKWINFSDQLPRFEQRVLVCGFQMGKFVFIASLVEYTKTSNATNFALKLDSGEKPRYNINEGIYWQPIPDANN